MASKPQKTFAQDWAEKTYTGRAVKAVVNMLPKMTVKRPEATLYKPKNKGQK